MPRSAVVLLLCAAFGGVVAQLQLCDSKLPITASELCAATGLVSGSPTSCSGGCGVQAQAAGVPQASRILQRLRCLLSSTDALITGSVDAAAALGLYAGLAANLGVSPSDKICDEAYVAGITKPPKRDKQGILLPATLPDARTAGGLPQQLDAAQYLAVEGGTYYW
jgi:hypothetical protein